MSDYQDEYTDDYLDGEDASLEEDPVARTKSALLMIEAYMEQRELDKMLREDFGFD